MPCLLCVHMGFGALPVSILHPVSVRQLVQYVSDAVIQAIVNNIGINVGMPLATIAGLPLPLCFNLPWMPHIGNNIRLA